ncbi:class I SAM-dependent methyltransferase [Psychrobium sp. nBUS_13]|uniref:class I SAM-dependent methyltransferase n=1 Tax=Psychrobium sp. nBUS_13 TaxID=3395319 RepID=UPI003EBD6956
MSWFQSSANLSLTLIEQACQKETLIIDIGGGASCLVEQLVSRQYRNISVLDISQQALDIAKQNLSKNASSNSLSCVLWHCSDLLTFNFETDSFGLWHDRAVFHFLTEDSTQLVYLKQLNKALKVGGCAVISTFDIGGPTQCSGIPIN